MFCRLAPLLLLALIMPGGCQEYGYRYKPIAGQTFYDPLFADYRMHENTVDIFVDTRGRKLEHIRITRPDGGLVVPAGIDYPAFVSEPIGGTEVPIEGPVRANGPTIAHFDKTVLGPRPWTLQVEVLGLQKAVFRIGG